MNRNRNRNVPVSVAAMVVVASVLAACSGLAPGSGAEGRAVYLERCVMCHGPGGKGDGDFADELIILPTDLTVLAQENGGTFPRLRVTEAIDGYARGSHFSGAMPEFGPLLAEGQILESGDGVVTPAPKLLVAVVDYLESIQE